MPQAFSKNFFKKLFISFIFILPVFIAYKNIIISTPNTWGDAPYFSNEYLNEVKFLPPTWDGRNIPLGGVNNFIFIHPIIYLISLTHKYLNLSSGQLVQIFFYFPSIIISFLSSYLIARKFTKNHYSSLLVGLFFSTNTYILMVIDGGQAGIAAAYGLAALTIYFGLNLNTKNLNYFFVTTTALFLTTVYDPRIALISLLFLFIYYLDNLKIYLKLFFITALLGIFSIYWIYPLFAYTNQTSSVAIDSSLKLIHAISLYHPNWPDNIYGIARTMPFYFSIFSILILIISLYYKKLQKLVFIFLIFTFLSQSKLIGIIDITGAFRDTTKFYLPLMLIASILLADIFNKSKNIYIKILIYIFVLILIWPALLGKLNFVLSNRDNINLAEPQDNQWYRTLFVPERYPLNYHSNLHPSLDGYYLFNLRPFAVNNAGTFDQFNYLNNIEAKYLYELLGIKNIVFTPNPRLIKPSDKQVAELELVRESIDKIEMPLDPMPYSWSVGKVVLVFGEESEEFYENILPHISKAAILYPQYKYYLDPNIYQNNNLFYYSEDFDINDLVMSMLDREYFIRLNNENVNNNWAYYGADRFNEYQYQLLIREISFRGFDYGAGISFSDQPNEKIVVNNLNSNNKLFIRYYCGSGEVNLNLSCEDKIGFKWIEITNSSADGGNIIIENINGLSIINAFVSVPNNIYEESLLRAENIISQNNIISSPQELVEQISNNDNQNNFVILNQSYSDYWRLDGNYSFPAYGMINVFENTGSSNFEIINSNKFNNFYKIGLSFFGVVMGAWGIYFIYTRKK